MLLKRVQLARDRLAEDVVPYVRSKLQKLLPHGWRVVNLDKAHSRLHDLRGFNLEC